MNVRPVFTHELGVFWEPIFPFPERHDMSADEKICLFFILITSIVILISKFIHSFMVYAF